MGAAHPPKRAHQPFDPQLGCRRDLNSGRKYSLRNAMGTAKKGHSAGENKLASKQSVSNKSQASWLQENDRHLWLEDHGMDADGVRKAGC
eukprot:1161265-Pelagomonas_calceolata.AAC.9